MTGRQPARDRRRTSRLASVTVGLGLAAAAFVGCAPSAEQGSDVAGEQAGFADGQPRVAAADSFFAALSALCGDAFAGRVVEDSQADSAMASATLVMHVRSCNDSVLRIPFHVGADRSRTWVVTRTRAGLRLKHDHRHADGVEDSITQYGGDTREAGSATRQEFAADAHTASLLPAAATNVWTITIEPGVSFAYALRREGTERRFRVVFDLTRPVPVPPAPWGADPAGP